jgi:hypothetical protein
MIRCDLPQEKPNSGPIQLINETSHIYVNPTLLNFPEFTGTFPLRGTPMNIIKSDKLNSYKLDDISRVLGLKANINYDENEEMRNQLRYTNLSDFYLPTQLIQKLEENREKQELQELSKVCSVTFQDLLYRGNTTGLTEIKCRIPYGSKIYNNASSVNSKIIDSGIVVSNELGKVYSVVVTDVFPEGQNVLNRYLVTIEDLFPQGKFNRIEDPELTKVRKLFFGIQDESTTGIKRKLMYEKDESNKIQKLE